MNSDKYRLQVYSAGHACNHFDAAGRERWSAQSREDGRAAARCAATLKLRDAQTYVQSGNVIFRTDERDLGKVSGRLEDAIEKKFKFRCDVISRTTPELKAVVGEKSVCQATRDRSQQAAGHVSFGRSGRRGPREGSCHQD